MKRTPGTVAVVGLGKIGMPLAATYVEHGWRVIGCDINPAVVEGINAGQCHVHEEPGLEEQVAAAVKRGALRATTDTTQAAREADVVVVIVPVIVTPTHDVDYRAIDSATRAIGAGLAAGKLVLYETTLPVGSTSQRFRKILEETSGLAAGEQFHLGYSPERVSSGHIARDLVTYPKVVSGYNAASADATFAFYSSVLDAPLIRMASTDDAEFVKLIETTYRDVNIALANEYARFADDHGLNVAAAIQAANTQPYSHIHAPGVGVGGHCIPVYPYFLMSGAAEGLELPRASRVINDGMADYAVSRIEAEIGSLHGKDVLLLGVAYRGDVKETAFTSAKLLRDALTARGASVVVEDPYFSDDELEALGYRPYRRELAHEVRAIIMQAAHQQYQTWDFSEFSSCRVVFDGRAALKPSVIESKGMRYLVAGDGKTSPRTVAGAL